MITYVVDQHGQIWKAEWIPDDLHWIIEAPNGKKLKRMTYRHYIHIITRHNWVQYDRYVDAFIASMSQMPRTH